MKIEIKQHNHYSNHLYSIKGIINDYEGRLYLSDFFSKLFLKTNFFFIKLNRRNYETNSIFERNRGLEILEVGGNYEEVLIYFNELNRDLIMDLWFAYEQPIFCFCIDKNDLEKLHNTLMKRTSWEQILNKLQTYVLFKSAEEDVLWFGKRKGTDSIDL
jgi:hypothetical protein